MKKYSLVIFFLFTASAFCYGQQLSTNSSAPYKLSSFIDSASFAYGTLIADNLSKSGISMSYDLLIQGILAGKNGTNQLKPEQTEMIMARLQEMINDKEKLKIEQLSKANSEKEKLFFAENAKKPNIKTTQSGLQYEQTYQGSPSGTAPTLTDSAVVNFEARFIDGAVFASSYEGGIPATIPLNQAIAGMQEGLLMMKPGDTYIFYIPSKLGYGEKGAPQIPPNQGLIFKIDLIKVIKGNKQ